MKEPGGFIESPNLVRNGSMESPKVVRQGSMSPGSPGRRKLADTPFDSRMTMSPPSPASDDCKTWIGGLGGRIVGLTGYDGIQGVWRPPPSIDLDTPRPAINDGSDSDVALDVASSPGSPSKPGEDDEESEDDMMTDQAIDGPDDEERPKAKRCLMFSSSRMPEEDADLKDTARQAFSRKGLSRLTVFNPKTGGDANDVDPAPQFVDSTSPSEDAVNPSAMPASSRLIMCNPNIGNEESELDSAEKASASIPPSTESEAPATKRGLARLTILNPTFDDDPIEEDVEEPTVDIKTAVAEPADPGANGHKTTEWGEPPGIKGTWQVAEDLCSFHSNSEPALPPLQLSRGVHDQLYQYQRDGVAWMWSLFRESAGGVLADEMGLGKTVQTCAFLTALVTSKQATRFLIVAPVTLLEHWRREAHTWGKASGMKVKVMHGSPKERHAALESVSTTGGILVTSYDLVRTQSELLTGGLLPGMTLSSRKRKRRVDDDDGESDEDLDAKRRGPQAWDVVIVDEAHRIKNPSCQVGRALRRIKAQCRLLLTGTPLQNNLIDLWALLDFAQPGLLGNHATFERNFSEQIARGSKRNAPQYAVELKDNLVRELKRLVGPYVLRRTKKVVMLPATVGVDASDASDAPAELPPKTDVVLWLGLSAVQKELYTKFLSCDLVRRAQGQAKCGMAALRSIAMLKKLSNHPLLCLHKDELRAWQVGQALPPRKEDGENQEDAPSGSPEWENLLRNRLPAKVEDAASDSTKLRVLKVLLPALQKNGHRCLLFSQSTRMLDLVQICVLRPLGLRFLRVDGALEARDRDTKIQKFEKDTKYFAVCLSTSVGGVGLTITGADRVVLIDPAWNPAMDTQAVDRVHRIGQVKPVVSYRLICADAIEDKMFRLQMFKRSLAKTALECEQQLRLFTHNDLKGLFAPPMGASSTQALMAEQLGSDALEHQELLDVVAQDVGGAEENADFWKSTDIFGFSDLQRLSKEGQKEEAPKQDKAWSRAQSIAAHLVEEEYIRDQVLSGDLKPTSPGKFISPSKFIAASPAKTPADTFIGKLNSPSGGA